jgi:hypothetical protein
MSKTTTISLDANTAQVLRNAKTQRLGEENDEMVTLSSFARQLLLERLTQIMDNGVDYTKTIR